MTSLGFKRSIRLDGAGVVITGASSGIGRALAEAVAAKRGRLVLAARRTGPLHEVADAVAQIGSNGTPPVVSCDVQNNAEVNHLIDTAIEHLGAIDVLVNNAGTCLYGDGFLMTPQDVEWMLRVHVLGPYYGMRAVVPHMQERGGGLIVNVASIAALHGVPYLGGYGAAKAAQVALSQSLRAELRGTGIQVMVVCPGYTDTNLFQSEKKLGGARRPRGRYRTADWVAASIVKAIERGRSDLILTAEGKLLNLARSMWPGLVDRVFTRMAARLQEDFRNA